MDTSEKYILLCEKAEEVQKEWTDKTAQMGDFYQLGVTKLNKPAICILGCHWKECEGCTTEVDMLRDECIWLPRQDQLQKMLDERKTTYFLVEDFSDFMTDNLLEDHGDVPYTPPFRKEWGKASMEQLWLAFVMHEKYSKQWDEEKGEWNA